MPSISRGINYLIHDRAHFCDSVVKHCFKWLPDKPYLSLRYRFCMGKWIDWKNPKLFTEKLQWLKVYNRKPEYTTMVDKYAVKGYVAERIGEKYIIPTLGAWDRVEDIDWDSLPNQFVLKTTHAGGGTGVVICRDKELFDRDDAIGKLKKSLNSDGYTEFREWPYKDVHKRIIAEKFISPTTSAPADLPDYKFFCFNGEPEYCQVIRDRHSLETIDFFDMDWNHQEFVGLNPVARNGLNPVARPKNLENMISICRELSKDIPFARVDLYVVDDKEYFGEITFYPASGFGEFTPEYWNRRLGDLLDLPESGGVKKYVITDGKITEINASDDELKDYKFFCFNGKVKFFKVDFGRFVEHHANYYSPAGELLDFGEALLPPDPKHNIALPDNLDQMIKLAEQLSGGQPFLRVDFYNVDGAIYFGELTFYPASGLMPFTSQDADIMIGSWLELPKLQK